MELIERERELAGLRAAAQRSARGEGKLVLVYGEAGIGKSALVRAAFDGEAAGSDARLLWGACEALFSPRPLGPLYDVGARLGEGVRQALARPDQRSELFDAVLDDLRSAGSPTVWVFDDIHWADAATLDLLKFLGRRLAGVPALLVLTFRDDEVDERHPLRGVLGDLPAAALQRMPLAPLSPAGVDELQRRSGVHRARLHEVTHGNPFFVTESLRGEGLPSSVRDAVLARFSRQLPAVRAVLELAAIVPGRIEVDLVDRLLAPSAADVAAAALSSGLLVADAKHYAFRHELARIAVEQSLAPPRAAALHAQVLAALEAAAGPSLPVTRLVHHAAGAGDAAAVLRLAPQAATQAAAHGAHHEAAQLLAMALRQADALPPRERAELLEQQAYQCYLVEQLGPAIEAREAALAIWQSEGDTVRQGHNLRWLSRLHWVDGDSARAARRSDEAIALLEAGDDKLELAWALSYRAQLHMLSGRMAQAIADGDAAVAISRTLGDAELQAHALNNMGAATCTVDLARGLAMLEESLRVSIEDGFSEQVARAYTNIMVIAILCRDYPTARHQLDRSRAYYASRRLDVWTSYHSAWQCRMDFEQCRWGEARALGEQLVAPGATSGACRMVTLPVLARLRLRSGEPGGMELLEEATRLATAAGELLRLAPVAVAHAEAAWLGLPGADLALVRRVIAQAMAQRERASIGELALWLQALGEPVEAYAALAMPGVAEHLSGRWQEAAAYWANTGCRMEQALALLSSGEPDAMREALAVVESLGLPATLARCRTLLRREGLKGVARGPRASTAENPAGLTARELEVLRLLVQGLTDAQIATRLVRSEKTVNHHVSSILGKLQARSRTEASALAVARGLLAQRAGPA